MNNIDRKIKSVPNEAVLCTLDGKAVSINVKKRERLIERLNNIANLHDESKFSEVEHLLREGWLMSSTYLAGILGDDRLFDFLCMYSRLMMEDSEIRYLDKLGDDITVYRGSNGTIDSKLSGLSWTSEICIATVYAVNRKGHVLTGKVKKSDVLSFFFDEQEFILKPNTVTVTDKITWQDAVNLTGIPLF